MSIQKLSLSSLPKHLISTDSHAGYENHRLSADAFMRQKMEESMKIHSHVTTHKAEEDLDHYKELEEKSKRTSPLEPNKITDQGMIELNGHIFVETGLMNKSMDLDKNLDREMDENISFLDMHSSLNPKVDNEHKYLSNSIRSIEKFAKANVMTHQQETKWTCSAACLKAVLNYQGHKISERECGIYIRVRKNKGAETTDIVNAAKALGFDAYEKSFSIKEAKDLTDKGIPIICDIQSFTKPGAGHYVVLTDIDQNKAYLMDPNVESNSRVIPLDEFEKRWFDYEMHPPHKLMKHWGIVINN
jgi:predicted double-glycine peptidase